MVRTQILVSALCFLALACCLCHAQTKPTADGLPMKIVGEVYCDPCDVEFKTPLSRPILGAKVQLKCRKREGGVETLSMDAVTNREGLYTLVVSGDHEEEICEINALESPDPKCNLKFKNVDSARIVLTENSGIQGAERYTNPLGFKTTHENIDAGCRAKLDELGIDVTP